MQIKVILEEETFNAYGYFSAELALKSNKPVLAACGNCGKVRKTRKYNYRSLCSSCAHKGEKHYNFGKIASEETKAKMSGAQKGEKNGNYGKRGKDASAYKGGKKLYIMRNNAKRKQLGHTVLLPLLAGEVGHHVTDEYVIGIPEDAHQMFCGYNRENHCALVLEWLKANDTKKYNFVLCVLATKLLK